MKTSLVLFYVKFTLSDVISFVWLLFAAILLTSRCHLRFCGAIVTLTDLGGNDVTNRQLDAITETSASIGAFGPPRKPNHKNPPYATTTARYDIRRTTTEDSFRNRWRFGKDSSHTLGSANDLSLWPKGTDAASETPTTTGSEDEQFPVYQIVDEIGRPIASSKAVWEDMEKDIKSVGVVSDWIDDGSTDVQGGSPRVEESSGTRTGTFQTRHSISETKSKFEDESAVTSVSAYDDSSGTPPVDPQGKELMGGSTFELVIGDTDHGGKKYMSDDYETVIIDPRMPMDEDVHEIIESIKIMGDDDSVRRGPRRRKRPVVRRSRPAILRQPQTKRVVKLLRGGEQGRKRHHRTNKPAEPLDSQNQPRLVVLQEKPIIRRRQSSPVLVNRQVQPTGNVQSLATSGSLIVQPGQMANRFKIVSRNDGFDGRQLKTISAITNGISGNQIQYRLIRQPSVKLKATSAGSGLRLVRVYDSPSLPSPQGGIKDESMSVSLLDDTNVRYVDQNGNKLELIAVDQAPPQQFQTADVVAEELSEVLDEPRSSETYGLDSGDQRKPTGDTITFILPVMEKDSSLSDASQSPNFDSAVHPADNFVDGNSILPVGIQPYQPPMSVLQPQHQQMQQHSNQPIPVISENPQLVNYQMHLYDRSDVEQRRFYHQIPEHHHLQSNQQPRHQQQQQQQQHYMSQYQLHLQQPQQQQPQQQLQQHQPVYWSNQVAVAPIG